MQGPPAPLTALPCLPAQRAAWQLCRKGSKSLQTQQTKRFQFSVTWAILLFYGSFFFRGMFTWTLPWSPVGGVFLLEISQIHCTFIYFKSFSLQMSGGRHSESSYCYPQTSGSGWHGASSAISQKYFYTEYPVARQKLLRVQTPNEKTTQELHYSWFYPIHDKIWLKKTHCILHKPAEFPQYWDI